MTAGDSYDESFNEVEIDEEGGASPADDLPERLRHLDEEERAQGLSLRQLFAEQEHGLRQKYGDWIIWLLGAQFVIADAVFVAFAWIGRSWDLPPAVIEVWLVATVIQVVGVVAIVTRHLFPNRDRSEASA
jgi:glutathione S-transferase